MPIVFHFNKGHLADPSIPMWVLKIKGLTYYVEHVIFKNVSFETKETPDNTQTKGSLKIKGFYKIEDGIATISGHPI